MRFKHNHSKTLRRFDKNKKSGILQDNEEEYGVVKSVINNPDLDKHRTAFLGKPGSKQWNDYYKGLMELKRQMFEDESIQEREKEDPVHFSVLNQTGGGPGDEAVAAAVAAAAAVAEAPTSVTASSSVTEATPPAPVSSTNALADIVGELISNMAAPTSVTASSSVTAAALTSTSATSGLTNIVEGLVKNMSSTRVAPAPGSSTSDNKLGRRINENNINGLVSDNNVPESGNNNNVTLPGNNGDKDPYCRKKGWLTDLLNKDNPKIKDLLRVFGKFYQNGDLDNDAFGYFNYIVDNIENPDYKDICKAEHIKSRIIPHLVEMYLSLIRKLKDVIDDNSKKGKEIASEIRSSILTCIYLLRNLNLYSNPTFFDDLYYYYYFLSLDKILPSFDDFFRLLTMPPPKPKKHKNTDVNVKMRVFEEFPYDDPSKQKYQDKHYTYEMEQTVENGDPVGFDSFLNFIQINRGDMYLQKHPIETVESNFSLKEVPLSNNTADRESEQKNPLLEPKLLEVNVTAGPKEPEPENLKGGGGLFGIDLGLTPENAYSYLKDVPFEREFDHIFKDEDAKYNGDVYLCIYSLDKSCNFNGKEPTPFLKFITQKNGENWGFPSFQYESFENGDDTNMGFKCKMFNHMMNVLEIGLCGQSDQNGGNPVPVPENGVSHPPPDNPIVENGLETPAESIEPPTDSVSPSPSGSTGELETPSDKPSADIPPPPPSDQPITDSEVNPPTESIVPPTPPDQQSTESVESTSITEDTSQSEKNETPVNLENIMQNCEKIDSTLDSIYVGLVLAEIQGKQTVFAFLNYDLLEKLVKTPENYSYGYVFCRNENTQLYPIVDANPNATLKWATVDELFFEQKIVEEPVDPSIAELFKDNDNLWNIENSEKCYIDFPFVVYGVQIDESTDKFKTVIVNEDVDKIEKYGIPPSEEEDGIAAEYRDRYCFTLHPVSFTAESISESDQTTAVIPSEQVYEPETTEPESSQTTAELQSTDNTEPESLQNPAELQSTDNTEPESSQTAAELQATDNTEPESSQTHAEQISEPAQSSTETKDSESEQSTVEPLPESGELQGNMDETKEKEENKKPLIQGGENVKPKRYAMFAWKTRYIITESEVDQLMSETQYGGDDSEKVESLEQTEEEPVYDEEDKNTLLIEKATFPTIYTITKSKYTNNKSIVTWGILESNQFTGL